MNLSPLIGAACLGCLATTAFAGGEIPGGFVAYYPADGDAVDASGNGNDGVLLNGATYGPGVQGSAFSFDGVDDRVVIPSSPSFEFGTGDFSIALWIRFEDLEDLSNGFLSKDTFVAGQTFTGIIMNICNTCGSGTGFGMGTPGVGVETRDVFGGVGPHTHARISTKIIDPLTWMHFTAVREGQELSFYLDGLLAISIVEEAPTDVTNDEPITLGSLNVGELQPFAGLIDDLLIYDRALTPDEVESFLCVVDPCPCVGDFDEDGLVGFADLVTVLATWGGPDGDVDGDGDTDFGDIVTLLALWGPCP